MPVDSSHAYARGRIYGDKSSSRLFPYIQRLFNWLEKQRAQWVWETFNRNSVMGNGCRLGPNAWCVNHGRREDIRLGNQVYCRGLLRCGARGNGRILIGDEVYIGDDSIINSESCVEVGQLTMISHSVHIFDSTGHPVDPYLRERDWRIVMGQMPGPRPDVESAPVRIGQRVWISFNSIVLQGVTIGDNAIVAAGSVVVHDVDPNTIVAGNPASVVKTLTLEGTKGS